MPEYGAGNQGKNREMDDVLYNSFDTRTIVPDEDAAPTICDSIIHRFCNRIRALYQKQEGYK